LPQAAEISQSLINKIYRISRAAGEQDKKQKQKISQDFASEASKKTYKIS
jgi:hypothetical protein